MKTFIITTAIILSAVLNIKAQNERKYNYRFSVDNVKKVIITTDGFTEVENSVSNEIECELKLTEKGKIIGFSNKDKLEEPTLVSEMKNGVLYISMNERTGLYVIGVSTYSQKLHYRIKIPTNVPVEINSSDECNINGRFKELVLNNESKSMLVLRKESVKYLNCNSLDKPVFCNGVAKGTNYFFEGIGEEKYIINSPKINIQFI